MIGRPASLQMEEGSSYEESWSVVQDRIDGWWKLITPQDSRRRVLVRRGKEILIGTKPRCTRSSSRFHSAEPSVASRVFDERSDKNRRTALDSTPGFEHYQCLLTPPTSL